jgi:hypothetical protein
MDAVYIFDSHRGNAKQVSSQTALCAYYFVFLHLEGVIDAVERWLKEQNILFGFSAWFQQEKSKGVEKNEEHIF